MSKLISNTAVRLNGIDNWKEYLGQLEQELSLTMYLNY